MVSANRGILNKARNEAGARIWGVGGFKSEIAVLGADLKVRAMMHGRKQLNHKK
jgi:hypothetical protein